jgi:RNA recognition motif-containing protein
MSGFVENVTGVVADVAAKLQNATIGATGGEKSVPSTASADEGRRLYIGNLAYATTEVELNEFFKGYAVYVMTSSLLIIKA